MEIKQPKEESAPKNVIFRQSNENQNFNDQPKSQMSWGFL